MGMGRQVIYAKEVEIFLDELLILLFEKGYFGFPEFAKQYVDNLTHYAEQHVGILSGKEAPEYFYRFGQNMRYIIYRANKTTQWYIFYQQRDTVFLVRHITNNHVAGQYFE
jgi:hypothetical protein